MHPKQSSPRCTSERRRPSSGLWQPSSPWRKQRISEQQRRQRRRGQVQGLAPTETSRLPSARRRIWLSSTVAGRLAATPTRRPSDAADPRQLCLLRCATQTEPNPEESDHYACNNCGLVVDALSELTRFRVELRHLEGSLQLCARCSPGVLEGSLIRPVRGSQRRHWRHDRRGCVHTVDGKTVSDTGARWGIRRPTGTGHFCQ